MWIDKKVYWQWKEDRKIIDSVPPAPSVKTLDYIQLGRHSNNKLCIGVWDDSVYTPLNRDELIFHLTNFQWQDILDAERKLYEENGMTYCPSSIGVKRSMNIDVSMKLQK